MTSTSPLTSYAEHFIDGAWRPCNAGQRQTIFDSFSAQPLAEVALGSAADVDAAVSAARQAFDGWSQTPVAQRADLLRRVGDRLAARTEELAAAVSREVGMPLKLSTRVQIQGPVKAWAAYAALADSLDFEAMEGPTLVRRVPVGVVGCITPWNYPLNQITAKVAPALLAGCTIVLKPSELAPATAHALAEALAAEGCPPGVFNLVHGNGAVAGAALAGHAGLDMVSFTGSTAIGRQVAAQAAGRIQRLALELGGKSASIVLDGADLGLAVKHALASCFLNSGQTCSALTRLVVPRGALPAATALLREGVATFRMGDFSDPATRLGPLVSQTQLQRVRGYVEEAIAQGAQVLAGGRQEDAPPAGYFFPPTVLLAEPSSRIAQEEVFGPVLCVIGHDGAADAVAIANGTPYGLAGAVWAADQETALNVARRLRTGQVDINGAAYNAAAPFGGFGQSGIGRENGRYGVEEYLELQAVQLPREAPAKAL